MYETFFGLSREPFSVAPDPAFLYMSAQHREALEHLNYGLRRGGGFVLLTGEIGAGKTTVWRCFLEQLPPELDVAYVVNPKLGVEALLARICEDLRVELPEGGYGGPGGKVLDPIDALHGHLLLAHARGRRTLVVVDEAQALSLDVLEQLRLLTNLDTSDRKLVQVLLIGQPELRQMLEKPVLEPLAQRVVARFHLHALPETETRNYIAHRLAVAGLVGELPFDEAALARIHELCGGVPRRINVLCDRTLIAAHAARERQVGRRLVDLAAGAVFGRQPQPVAADAGAAAAAPAAGAAGLAAPPVALRPGGLLAAGAVGAVVALAVALATGLGRGGSGAPSALPGGAAGAVGSAAAAGPTGSPAVAGGGGAAAMAGGQAPSSTAVALAEGGAADARALDQLLQAASNADEARAWRALARLWGVTLGPGEACGLALQQGLRCHRGRGGLAALRQLDRPAILRLADEQGRASHALLVGLAGDRALLRTGGSEHSLPLGQLARAWRGDFATLWKLPPGWREGEPADAAGPLAPWLGERLGQPDGNGGPAALRERLQAFQLAQGLQPDGVAGPLTLMQLNRSSGVDEPRLAAAR